MNTFELMNVAFTALERRKEQKPSPDVALCDDCGERTGTNKIVSAGTDTLLCDECVEDDYREMRRLPRFRTNDERDAYEAGVRARGEI
jgi:formylmethanofuran dehydrogenase subunit E